MTEPDRRAPDGVGPDPNDPTSDPAAAGSGPAEATDTGAPEATDAGAPEAIEPAVAGDPIALDPDLAPSSAPTEVAIPLAPVGPGAPPAPERAAPRVPSPSRRPVDRRPGRAPAPPPLPTPSDQAVHVDDRISMIFVLATVGVFVLILLNGLLLGRGGTLSASPSPSPSPAASISASPSASAGPSSSASPAPSGSASPSGSPAASRSAAPASPSASPAASPS